ncbi:MAG: cytochrome c-type biogenesis protein [Actinomycetes bacterium]
MSATPEGPGGGPATIRSRGAWMAAWVVLAVLAVGAVAWAVRPTGTASDAERVRSLASEIRCPDCESLSAADSQTGSARSIRQDLRTRVAAGESDARIRQEYADRYGDSILLKPAADGLGLLVWGLPVLLLVVAAGGLVLAFRRWRRTPTLQATDADEDLVRRARSQRPR